MATLDTGRSWSDQLRDQAFAALGAAMPAANLSAALRCSARLEAEFPHRPELERNLVLVAYGGGKDSSYTLAFVRAMQLILARVHGRTFRLRVATNRHAGMPRAVMENIARAYDALGLTGDPTCELLLIDGNEVTRFDVDAPQREHVVRRNRLDILMTGHRTFADGRPTFCNSCNLSVSNSFGVAASHGEGADLIITGDSPQEQREYSLWVARLANRVGTAGNGRGNGQANGQANGGDNGGGNVQANGRADGQDAGRGTRGGNGLRRILSRLDGIAHSYFTDIHGPDATADIAERRVSTEVPERLRFFSIYPDTEYASGDHMELLTGFLGFEFDDHAFSFTESDCGNPALMAHLRGLKAERLFQRSYAEGVAEYSGFALGLMERKDFPPELIATMRARYAGPDAVDRMRRSAGDYALETYGLTEEQLVTMACSPFAGAGAGLEEFLGREHPGLTDRAGDVHALLAGRADAPTDLVPILERISGLELRRLQVLYGRPLRRPGAPPGGDGAQIIDAVLAGDPHKAVISTRHSTDGPHTLEQISGR